jgi:hypothetical protein
VTAQPQRPGVVGQVLARAADPAYGRWAEQVERTGFCARPVRLAGRVETLDPATGELHGSFSTNGEPDGTLLKACGQRRESVCPSCSATYRADAWQLIAAGLRGGKGLPESVAAHPRLFVTLTAPSFGPVHSRRERDGRGSTCAPRRGRCPHGDPAGCFLRHRDGDPALGTAICDGCFDYMGAVLWNAHAPALWVRTNVYVARTLARLAGLARGEYARTVRVAYVKVAEFQARGLVHFHVVARLDGYGGDGAPTPPPAPFTATLLARAVHEAAATVVVPYPTGEGGARWGAQVDIRPIRSHDAAEDGTTLSAEAVAAYIAKYATKSSAALGMLDRRLAAEDLDRLRVNDHIRAMVETCWTLGGQEEWAHLHLRRWAHMLGFAGHWGTKSRAYSTTFAALRAARATWAATTRDHAADAGIYPVENLRPVGIGYRTTGDAWLAETARRDHLENRAHARADAAKTDGGKPRRTPAATGNAADNSPPARGAKSQRNARRRRKKRK